ncbi:hypothetical protein [Roseibium sediminis]|uniref:hypothetical protein n=1 Tax=Roseibium sediminis TaxID=1775174 RepID=UPI00123D1F31|nr:hypothetical protein [Roseibium sediminis]
MTKQGFTVISLTTVLTLATAFSAFPAFADVGDYYLRSIQRSGKLNGAHEISPVPLKGLIKTTFCNRDFWMRDTTVLWSDTEMKEGRSLVIIQETSDGRRTVCNNATDYVATNVKKLPPSLREAKIGGPTRSRLNVISEAFKDFK